MADIEKKEEKKDAIFYEVPVITYTPAPIPQIVQYTTSSSPISPVYLKACPGKRRRTESYFDGSVRGCLVGSLACLFCCFIPGYHDVEYYYL